MIERQPERAPLLPAKNVIEYADYEGINQDAFPLVSSIDYVTQKFRIREPRVVEIGPVPTLHYHPGYHTDLDHTPDQYDEKAHRETTEKDIPPIWHLAERHPDWKFAAVSPHNIPQEAKSALLPSHEDIYISRLGPNRPHGLHSEDVWDKDYMKGGNILRKSYPTLLQKLGDKPPNVILGRHVFDGRAKGYLVGKLTAVAAMILEKNGLLVSHVYGSDAEHSLVPLHSYRFPFDSQKNMRHVMTIEFDEKKKRKDYVFVYQKTGDVIRPDYIK